MDLTAKQEVLDDPVINRTPWSLPPEAYFEATEEEYKQYVDEMMKLKGNR